MLLKVTIPVPLIADDGLDILYMLKEILILLSDLLLFLQLFKAFEEGFVPLLLCLLARLLHLSKQPLAVVYLK